MRRTPQLITYVDRLAGDLDGLIELLDGALVGAFTGVHVLPFYLPIDGADAGFDPIDHTAVDPRLGTWDDIGRLAARYEVMADLIVNHVSDESDAFQDWLRHGRDSAFDGMFLTFDTVFPERAGESDLTSVYRPRPGLPLTRVRLDDETVRLVWTTFTSHQVDIDVSHPRGWAYLTSIIDRLAGAGVSQVRLDAVGYAVKRAGTSCFMIPETFAFVDRLTAELRRHGIDVLVEVHGHHQVQLDIARRVDLVYDFALPPLLLDACYRHDVAPLRRWLEMRPANAINVLDTHDGIGVIDVGADPTDPSRHGLLDAARLSRLVDDIHEHSGGTSRLATGAAASNLDLYQVNCTYFDALGRNDRRYLAARLIQCLLPGTPQIYYVGLLAGSNDLALLERTGVGRDVNRHHYGPHELAEALRRPVVQSLLHLLRWRCRCDVFDGTFSVVDDEPHRLALHWDHPGGSCTALDAAIDVTDGSIVIHLDEPGGRRTVTSVDDL